MITHPYFPRTVAQDYYAFSVTGKFNPATHMLEVTSAARLSESDHRRHYVAVDFPLPWTAMVYTEMGGTLPLNWRDVCYGSIQALGAAPGGKGFIGEAGEFTEYFKPGTPVNPNCHLFMQPEPELPVNVTEYRTPVDVAVSGNRYNKLTGEIVTEACPCRFRNIGPGPNANGTWWWPQFPDQLLTCLMERPDTYASEDIYNYCWAKNVGLLSAVWITRQRDNTGSGYMFQLKT